MSHLTYTYVTPVYASSTLPEAQIRASFDNRLEALGAVLRQTAWYQIEASCPETGNKKVPVLVRCDRVTEEEHEGKRSKRMQFTITIPDEHIKPQTCRLVADRLARKITNGPLALQRVEAHRSVKRGDTSTRQSKDLMVEGLGNANRERSRLA